MGQWKIGTLKNGIIGNNGGKEQWNNMEHWRKRAKEKENNRKLQQWNYEIIRNNGINNRKLEQWKIRTMEQ